MTKEEQKAKGVGTLGSVALLVLSMTGPGLAMIPPLYQQAGWIVPTIVLFIVSYLSAIASLFLCEVLSSIRGNEKFQAKLELTTLVKMILGKKYHYFFQLVLYLALQAVNVGSIVMSAQTMDNLIVALFKGTCGVKIPGGWVCVHNSTALSGSPFDENDYYLFTTGLILTVALVMPLGFFDLDDSMGILIASFFVLLAVSIQWVVAFCQEGLKPELVPATGPSAQMVLGIIIFNFSYVTTVPTWVNSLKPGVSVHKCLTYALTLNTLIYLILGIFGGLAYPMQASDNILSILSTESTVASQVTSYLFPVAALITSIPVVVIVIRSNLIRGGLCKRRWAIFWSNIVPWLVTIPLVNKNSMSDIQNWASLFFQSTVNYILPFVLYFVSRRCQAKIRKDKQDVEKSGEPPSSTASIISEQQQQQQRGTHDAVTDVTTNKQTTIENDHNNKTTPNSNNNVPSSAAPQTTPTNIHANIVIMESKASSDPEKKQHYPEVIKPSPIAGESEGQQQQETLSRIESKSSCATNSSSVNNKRFSVTLSTEDDDTITAVTSTNKEEEEEEYHFKAFKTRAWLNPFSVAVISSSLLGIAVVFMIIYDVAMAALGNNVFS